MRIGITGGAGFIGSNLARSLKDQKHEIRVLDDFSSGLHANIADLDCEVTEGSLVDPVKVSHFVSDVEFVFHLGARGSVPRSIVDPQQTFEVNVLGTQNVLEAIRKKNIPIVFSSSSSVYGNNSQLPKTENLMLDPISPYAASKAAGEHLVQAYSKSYNLDCRIFRFFNVFGPRQRPDHVYSAVIPKWIWAALHSEEVQIFGDGQQIRDFTYVGDVVSVLSHCLTQPSSSVSPVNLAFGNPVSLNALVEILQDWFPELKVGVHPPRSGDVHQSYNDPSKLFAFVPDLVPSSLKQGLEATIEWLKEELDGKNRDSESSDL